MSFQFLDLIISSSKKRVLLPSRTSFCDMYCLGRVMSLNTDKRFIFTTFRQLFVLTQRLHYVFLTLKICRQCPFTSPTPMDKLSFLGPVKKQKEKESPFVQCVKCLLHLPFSSFIFFKLLFRHSAFLGNDTSSNEYEWKLFHAFHRPSNVIRRCLFPLHKAFNKDKRFLWGEQNSSCRFTFPGAFLYTRQIQLCVKCFHMLSNFLTSYSQAFNSSKHFSSPPISLYCSSYLHLS